MSERGQLGKQAAATGAANESRLLAALLARGYNASLVDLPQSTYDIIVEHEAYMIRVQVKTANKSISFLGGVRGGVDREYKSDKKKYIQNTTTSDIVVGVKTTKDNGDTNTDFYFIPTIFIEQTLKQQSLSLGKAKHTRNDWDILRNCKNEEWVMQRFIGAP